jgi:CRP-like cAMP-binding protein
LYSNNKYPFEKCKENILFFQLLSEGQIELLMDNSSIVEYKKKDNIFRQNTRTSHIMVMLDGLVKVYKESRNDRTIILKLVTPGSYMGSLSVLGDQVHRYSASAVEDSLICFIDLNVFRNIILENGKFALKLLSLISKEGLFIFERLMGQSHKQLPGRLADVLIYFADEIYGSQKFTFPLTRRELAELAGTTKESFIRTLTEFKNDKIINLDGSNVEIVSRDIVNTLSELG